MRLKLRITTLFLSPIFLLNTLQARDVSLKTWYLFTPNTVYRQVCKININNRRVSIAYYYDGVPSPQKEVHLVKLLKSSVNKNYDRCDTYLSNRAFEMKNNDGSNNVVADTIKYVKNRKGEILSVSLIRPLRGTDDRVTYYPSTFYTKAGCADFIVNLLNGNKYYALLGESCKEFAGGGGCTSYRHCLLKFSRDSVQVTTYATGNCEFERNQKPYSKSYKYKPVDSVLNVTGLKYLPLSLDFPNLGLYTLKDIFNKDGEKTGFSYGGNN